jgi:hypothetical protein
VDDEEGDTLLRCDGETVTLTKEQLWRLRDIVGAYNHLTTHPAGVGAAIVTLRLLRRAVREYFSQGADVPKGE